MINKTVNKNIDWSKIINRKEKIVNPSTCIVLFDVCCAYVAAYLAITNNNFKQIIIRYLLSVNMPQFCDNETYAENVIPLRPNVNN